MDQALVSAGKVNITPRSAMMLGGDENRKTPSRSVADELEANVLRIEGKLGRVVITHYRPALSRANTAQPASAEPGFNEDEGFLKCLAHALCPHDGAGHATPRRRK